ncbi:CPBP family glutamic-type intramembrane protease [Spirosoma fluviale]|uniref:CAAX protease self-immunity n=1 Tax=Spirosoma fluviale TaxID=1597977 RepID=A0A286G017_9BACT|nr:CPBP family glutamic-type intramembrane protease [Spirosoma fluviale]SOD88855.1 CAAX protease self-immunity [Spirosoma fluviale]
MVTRIVLPIIVFAGLAFAFSWAINQYLPALTWLTIDGKEVLTGCGPALSGLLCYRLFKTPNTFKLSLAGSKPIVVYGITFLSLLVPVLLSKQPNPLAAIGLVLAQFTYTLGEEFGWRHYLQNAVATFNKWQQALIIGTIWFFWHYAILPDPTTMLNGQPLPFYIGVPVFVGLLTLFSKLASDVVLRTQAVLLPTVLHYIGKVSNSYSMLAFYILVLAAYLMWHKIEVKRLSST